MVNPQELGAARMASFVVRPNVAEFVDVVMHDRSMEFRMQEVEIPDGSPLDGRTLRQARLRDDCGALVLALRNMDGSFTTNPDLDTVLRSHHIVIAVGTEADLRQPRRTHPTRLMPGVDGEMTWLRVPNARLAYDSRRREWTLYFIDSNDKVRRYPDFEPSAEIQDLLDEVDEDPTCIFWG